jgi:signal transduction histidine kinase
VFLAFPGVVGVSVRLWSTSRRRELERVRAREREEFARELHDTGAHHVSAIVDPGQSGRVVAGDDPAAAVRPWRDRGGGGAHVGGDAADGRHPARRRRRAPLSPRAGVADLHRLVGTPGGPRVEVRLDGDLEGLPPAVDAAVHRIAQESVTNALRHAVGVTEVVVLVAAEPGRVRVTVRDDVAVGRHGAHREGYGLTGLRERATLLA